MKFDIVYFLTGLSFLGIFIFAWGSLLDFKMNFEISIGMNLGIFIGIGFHFLGESFKAKKKVEENKK